MLNIFHKAGVTPSIFVQVNRRSSWILIIPIQPHAPLLLKMVVYNWKMILHLRLTNQNKDLLHLRSRLVIPLLSTLTELMTGIKLIQLQHLLKTVNLESFVIFKPHLCHVGFLSQLPDLRVDASNRKNSKACWSKIRAAVIWKIVILDEMLLLQKKV